MNRLIEKTVFSGLVIALSLGDLSHEDLALLREPTNRRREPGCPPVFAMTVGLPPSTTETTEFVVPRSIPMTFAI